MRKRILNRTFFVVVFILLFVIGILGCYWVIRTLQVSYITTLGWENDRYLWGAGRGGVIRWDVNQEAIIYSSFRPDGIEQFFISQEGQVWAYGHSIWRFEAGNWVERNETADLKLGKIHNMIQTRDGTVWIATWYGFKTWNELRHKWEPTTINQPAQTLVESSDGTLWFGMVQDGVIERRPSGEEVYWTAPEGLTDNRIESLLIANDGIVWVGTQKGASRWDGRGWQRWYDFGTPDPDGLIVYKFYETNDRNIWAATSEDLAKWNGNSWATYSRSPFCLPNFNLVEMDDGTLWAGCPTGLFRWNGSDWREQGESKGIRDSSFSHLVQASNGTLYVHTRSGLYQYISEQDHWQAFPNK